MQTIYHRRPPLQGTSTLIRRQTYRSRIEAAHPAYSSPMNGPSPSPFPQHTPANKNKAQPRALNHLAFPTSALSTPPLLYTTVPRNKKMPIVGAPPQFEVITLVSTISANRTAKSYDVDQYSHSTVFTFWSNATKSENAPPLTTLYQPPDVCRGRWMLIDNGADVVTTLVQTRTAVNTTMISIIDELDTVTAAVTLQDLSSAGEVVAPVPSPEPTPGSSVASESVGGPFRVVKREEVEAREILTAFRYTAWSMSWT